MYRSQRLMARLCTPGSLQPVCFREQYEWTSHPWHLAAKRSCVLGLVSLVLVGGCGDIFAARSAPLFTVPLTIVGEPVDPAVIDTGGDYELMLRDSFGLKVVDNADVLAFGGREQVNITEGFRYTAGGLENTADGALVGLSVCNCNGLGFHFFRETGVVLGVNFASLHAAFLAVVPAGGVTIPFQVPPPFLTDFDGAFVEVDVASGGESRAVLALLDTGTNASMMQRGLVGTASSLTPDRLNITIGKERFGTVAVQVGLFDTEGLPDLIIGTDVMRAWSDRWYFFFAKKGGTVTVFPRVVTDPADAN